MASVERDNSIAPAILDLPETRAIARSLRFAGHGVEYSSAEEVSHLLNGGNAPPPDEKPNPSLKGLKGWRPDLNDNAKVNITRWERVGMFPVKKIVGNVENGRIGDELDTDEH